MFQNLSISRKHFVHNRGSMTHTRTLYFHIRALCKVSETGARVGALLPFKYHCRRYRNFLQCILFLSALLVRLHHPQDSLALQPLHLVPKHQSATRLNSLVWLPLLEMDQGSGTQFWRYLPTYDPKVVPKFTTRTQWNPLLDSSNMEPSDWIRIATEIELNYTFDAFVILHGTGLSHSIISVSGN